jgi:leucyl-tRNA synthetase
VPKAADKEAIQELAVSNANVKKFIEGQAIKKIVVVPGRLINLVV